MRIAASLVGLGLIGLMSGCDFDPDHTQTRLVADYLVVTDYEGFSCLHFQKHFWSKAVPIIQLDSAAVIGDYLATCMSEEGRYFFLPLHPASKAAIKKKTIGPLNRTEYRLKISELGGDTAFRLAQVQ